MSVCSTFILTHLSSLSFESSFKTTSTFAFFFKAVFYFLQGKRQGTARAKETRAKTQKLGPEGTDFGIC